MNTIEKEILEQIKTELEGTCPICKEGAIMYTDDWEVVGQGKLRILAQCEFGCQGPWWVDFSPTNVSELSKTEKEELVPIIKTCQCKNPRPIIGPIGRS